MFGFGRKDDAEKRAKQILKEIEKRNTAVSALVWKVSKAECDAAILQLEIADAAAYEQLARIEKNPGVAEHYRELAQKYRQAVQEDREKLTKLPRSQIPTQRCAICGKPTGGTTYCSVHTTMMYGLGKHHGH